MASDLPVTIAECVTNAARLLNHAESDTNLSQADTLAFVAERWIQLGQLIGEHGNE